MVKLFVQQKTLERVISTSSFQVFTLSTELNAIKRLRRNSLTLKCILSCKVVVLMWKVKAVAGLLQFRVAEWLLKSHFLSSTSTLSQFSFPQHKKSTQVASFQTAGNASAQLKIHAKAVEWFERSNVKVWLSSGWGKSLSTFRRASREKSSKLSSYFQTWISSAIFHDREIIFAYVRMHMKGSGGNSNKLWNDTQRKANKKVHSEAQTRPP